MRCEQKRYFTATIYYHIACKNLTFIFVITHCQIKYDIYI